MITEPTRREGERLDDLQRDGLHILQKPSGFRFGMDAVLLAHFTRMRPRDTVADFGTGSGILPLLMSQMESSAMFHGIELQPDMADMARRSVLLNGLEGRITIHAADLREAPALLGCESMNGVVCNPPYGKRGSVIVSEREGHLLARHETDCALDDILKASAAVLRNQGRFWAVFPAARALELLDGLRACHLEPKRLRMVCAKASKPPYLLMVEAVKNAKPMLTWLPPLIVYHENGEETDELLSIYGEAAR